MSKIVYVGKPSRQYGKTLWEILGNLKNYGVGRLVTRSDHLRYEEPCFHKIVHVEAEAKREGTKRTYDRRVIAWSERIFRGRRYPKLIDLCSISYKPDFRLVPKDEEEQWYERLAQYSPKERIYDPYIPLPPLLNLIIKEEKKARGEPVEDVIKIPVQIRTTVCNTARLAREGETPTHYFHMSFSEPTSPSLFENIEACRPLFENRDPYKDQEAQMLRAIKKKNS